jgi:uridine kinase
VHDKRRSALVLVSGLSRAGKSTFARQLCEAIAGAQHLPLDRYFLAVPPGLRFIDWVQSPASIDWATLRAHLARLSSGQSCYTPCLDYEGSGRRLSDGGERPHARRVRVTGGAPIYVLPGCYAFAAPRDFMPRYHVFVRTPLALIAERILQHRVWGEQALKRAPLVDIAERMAGQPVPDWRRILEAHQPRYRDVLAYEAQADLVVDGTGTQRQTFARAVERIGRWLGE